jgi:small-conductance mechanosensitive channel
MKELSEFLSLTIFSFKNYKLTVSSVLTLLLVILVTIAIKRAFKMLLHRTLVRRNVIDTGRETSISSLFNYVLYVIAFVVGIETIGVDITILIGASAALMVGVGLGLQDTFKDIFSGIVLLLEGVFKVDDVIEFNGIVCKVLRIDLRTSQVETRDGTVIIVPNGKLVNDNIINWSLNHADTRFKIVVGVAYGSDTAKVQRILYDIFGRHKDITRKDLLSVRFADFADSALTFEIYFWTRRQWVIEQIKSELRFEIDEAFRTHKISIPFPQRDVHVFYPENEKTNLTTQPDSGDTKGNTN